MPQSCLTSIFIFTSPYPITVLSKSLWALMVEMQVQFLVLTAMRQTHAEGVDSILKNCSAQKQGKQKNDNGELVVCGLCLTFKMKTLTHVTQNDTYTDQFIYLFLYSFALSNHSTQDLGYETVVTFL